MDGGMRAVAPVRVSCVAGQEPETVPTALYRHFDKDGALLYVGISLSPAYRLSQHRDAAHWFPRIAEIKIEWHPSRVAALAAEKAAIQSERPECNIQHQPQEDEAPEPAATGRWDRMMELSLCDLTRRLAKYKVAYSIKEAGDTLGLNTREIRQALYYGDLSFFVAGSRIVITGWALIEYLEALQSGAAKVRGVERLPDGSCARPPNMEEIIEACAANSCRRGPTS